jgi:DNA-binding NtrC family response regulator
LSVLLVGETGTGKEVVARAVHEASGRIGRLVAENCAALPDSLLEAELFGARRGAFTGSQDSRRGLLLEADGGTLLLDEIGEMSAHLQAKLLRALQEREVRPLGASRPTRFDARLLAATNRGAGRAGSPYGLRSDLYYRLAAITVELPPLRRRRRDLPWLAATLLARAREEGIGPGRRLGPDGLARLTDHRFPGNVRELDNVLRHAAALSGGPTIGAALIGAALGNVAEDPWEAQMIRDALDSCGGVKSEAARRLGWTRQKLYRRLDKLGLSESPP